MKRKRVGRDSYIERGLNKVLTIYVSEETHKALVKQAAEEERSLQTVVRRTLEQNTKTD
jgi:predicted HicB family RNase H-like nuclease